MKIKKKLCGAPNRNCNTPINEGKRCTYRFKEGETVCPKCGAERRKCMKFALAGTDRCKYHGK